MICFEVAYDSLVRDTVTGGVGLAFVLGRRTATRGYTFGWGRAEDLAGLVVVLLIAASAAVAGYTAVRHLIDPQPITHLWIVAAAGLIGFGGNELVARWRITVGRQIGSASRHWR